MSLEIGSKGNFYIQAVSLRCIGIKVLGERQAPLDVHRVFWLFFFIDLLRVCCTNAVSFSESTDLNGATKILATSVQDFLSLWKILVFIATRTDVMKLVNEINMKSMEADPEELPVVLQELRRNRVLTTTYYTACILTAVACIVGPLGGSAVLSYVKNEPTFILPFQGEFLIDCTQLGNYIVILVFSAMSLYFAINACVAVDSIYSWFVNAISAQFQRLELKLQRATAAGVDSKKLRDCIRYHQWIIRVTDQFANLYRPIIFVKFSLNSLQICLIVFHILLDFSLHSTPFLVIFLGAVIIQLIIYCYAGQKLQTESERIAVAMHDCIHLANRGNKSFLLLIMMRTQRCS